jgi:hypothetical protein
MAIAAGTAPHPAIPDASRARSEPGGEPRFRHGPAILLILIGYALGLSASFRQSMTSDEIFHLTAGYAYWTTGNFRLHPENGNLPQRLAALPLLAMDLKFPPLDAQPWRDSDALNTGRAFFYDMGNDDRAMLMAGRAAIGLLTVALWATIHACAARLFGRGGAMLALTVSVFCPTLLAHGFLATSDVCATLFFLWSTLALHAALRRPNVGRVLLAVGAAGGLCVSKFSAPLLAPIALALIAFRVIGGEPMAWGRHTLVCRGRIAAVCFGVVLAVAFGAVAVIWAFFHFRFPAISPADAAAGHRLQFPWTEMASAPSLPNRAIHLARDLRLLPEAYLFGQAHTLDFAHYRRMFLLGEYGVRGWPHYYLVTTLLKTPWGTLILWALLAAMAAMHWRRWRSLAPALPLLTMAAIYGLVIVFSPMNIGHRHALPAIVPLLILAGAAWTAPPRRRVPALLAAMTVGQSLLAWPDPLPFTNGLAGPPRRAWRAIIDSNIDWGQDLDRLESWIADHRRDHPAVPIHVAYFGTAEIRSPHIGNRLLNCFPYQRSQLSGNFIPRLEPGVYCLSVNILSGAYHPLIGPWCELYESQHARARWLIDQMDRMADDDALAAEMVRRGGQENVRYANALREARLLALLRQRPPDGRVGHSMMVYNVTDSDLRTAQHGPPPELRANPFHQAEGR